jgi:phytoene dehydrogenase-like protein
VGVKADLAGMPHMLLLPLAEPLRLDPQTALDEVIVHNHSYDPTLAPAGSTLLTLMLPTYDYEYWSGLRRAHKDRYENEKARISGEIVRLLEGRWSGLASKVEMTDVATPATFGRFSGNWNGSFEGWQLTPEQGLKHLSHRLPGLKNFFMCGQWVAIGGGLPGVLLSGRDTAQLVCDEDGKTFECGIGRDQAQFGG